MVQNRLRAVDLVGVFPGIVFDKGCTSSFVGSFLLSFADCDELRILVRSDCKSNWQSLKAVSDVPFSGGCRLMGSWDVQENI